MKKLLMCLLAALLLAVTVCAGATEAEPAAELSGSYWSCSGTVLTITGNVPNYGLASSRSDWFIGTPFETNDIDHLITEIVVQEGVTELGNLAFYGFSSLQKVTFPSTLQRIGSETFMNCRALTEVTIPASVNELGHAAFLDCQGLTKITFNGACPDFDRWDAYYDFSNPNTYIFSGCTADVYYRPDPSWTASAMAIFSNSPSNNTSLTWHADCTDSGSCTDTIQWYLLDDGTLYISGSGEIPDYSDFGAPWYNYAKTTTRIVISDNITRIGNCAFYHCTAASVHLPEKLTSLGHDAFYSAGLTSLVIPDGVTELPASVFSCNFKLTSVQLPANLKTLGDYALANAPLASLTLPVGLETIQRQVFSGMKATEVVIPSGVTSLDFGAFANCTELTSVTIPWSVTSMNSSAFLNCPNLTCRVYTNSYAHTWCEENSQAYELIDPEVLDYTYVKQANGASQAISITGYTGADAQITVPAVIEGLPVVWIGADAFYENMTVTSVTLPEGLWQIGPRAFSGCDNLETVNIPDTVGIISEEAFAFCDVLANITLPSGLQVINDGLFDCCLKLTSISIPDGVLSIGNAAFANCRFASIEIPASVNSIGARAFRSNSALTSIVIPDSVTYMGANVFESCTNLTSATLPAGLTAIPEHAFRNAGLTAFTFPEGVTSIGQYAFSGCPLNGIVLPEGLTSVDYGVFGACKQLTSVTLPDSLTTIGLLAFSNCEKLETITIGRNVTSMEDTAFSGCSNLLFRVYARSYAHEWCINGVKYYELIDPEVMDYSYTIANGEATITAYKGTAADITIPSVVEGYPVTAIGMAAFYQNKTVTSVVIPDSVRTIGAQGFLYCSNLTSVTLPAGLTAIGNNLFNSTGLTSLVIPESVTAIGDYAFMDCPDLTTLTISENITSIGKDAFAGSTDVVLNVYRDSYAHTWCWDNGIAFDLIGAARPVIAVPSDIMPAKSGFYLADIGLDVADVRAIFPAEVKVRLAGGMLMVEDYGAATMRFYPNGGSGFDMTLRGDVWMASVTDGAFTDGTILSYNGTKWEAHYDWAGGDAQALPQRLIASPNGDYVVKFGESVECDDSNGVAYVRYNTADGLYIQDCYYLTGALLWEVVSRSGDVYSEAANYNSIGKLDTFSATVGNNYYVYRVGSGWECNYSSCAKPSVFSHVTDAWIAENYPTQLPAPDPSLPFIYLVENGAVTLTGYTGDAAEVEIPAEIEGLPVTKLGDQLFEGCENLTRVTLPDSITTIGEGAFARCYNLAEINIPEGVTSLADVTFDNCYALTNLEFPAGFTSIGTSCFRGCSGLTEIILPEGVTSLSIAAFAGCSGLTKILLPQSVTSIGTNALYACSNLVARVYEGSYAHTWCVENGQAYELIVAEQPLPYEYTIANGEVTITGYTGTETAIEVPATIEDCPVTAIGGNAFAFQVNLTSVTLPAGVKRIGDYAFDACTGLASLTLPESLEEIGEGALSGCSGLTALTLPDGLTTIGAEVFNLCTGLKEVTMPVSVTAIGVDAFYGCNVLTVRVWANSYAHTWCVKNNQAYEVIDPENLPPFTYSVSNNEVTITKYTGTGTDVVIPATIAGLPVTCVGTSAFAENHTVTSVVIPEGVTFIDIFAFYDCPDLTSLSLPSTLKTIGSCAISSCIRLKSVTLPQGLESMGSQAFAGCIALESISIPSSVTEIGELCFYSCEKLDGEVVIPDGIQQLASGIFSQCYSLDRVVLPESLLYIERGAFEGCYELQTIDIPSGVLRIGNSAFAACFMLDGVVLPEGIKRVDQSTFSHCCGLTSIVIPNGVTEICNTAFENCNALTSLTIPESVTSIATDAFNGCTSLTARVWANSYAHIWCMTYGQAYEVIDPENLIPYIYTIENGEVTITGYTGTDTELEIPATIAGLPVTAIGGNAFEKQNTITSVVLPDTLTKIYDEAFRDCTHLQSINLPAGLTMLDDSAFYGCVALNNVVVPNGVTWMRYTFGDCKSLTNVTLPESLDVFDGVFVGCSALEQIELPQNLTSMGEYSFQGCSMLRSIEIPETVTKIGARCFDGCTSLAGEIVIPEGVKRLEDWTFSGCTSLTGVVLPEKLTFMGNYVFYGCSCLEAVEIPDTVLDIGECAFLGCAKLQEMVLPDGLTKLCWSLFNGCTSLKKVIIPEGVGTIDNYAFQDCKALETLVIPAAVRSIGDWAFNNCDSLTELIIPDGVTQLGTNTFSGCTSLVNVFIPESVVSIEADAFVDCSADLVLVSSYDAYARTWANENGVAWRHDVHTEEVLEAVDPTCAEAGLTEGKYCAVCGEVIVAQEEIPTLPHTEITLPAVERGELTPGYTEGMQCSVCGEYIVEPQIIPPVFEVLDGTLIGYNGDATDVVIPENAGIVRISDGVFQNTGVTSVVIPEGVTRIEDYTFRNCNVLTRVTIPQSVTSIGICAFECTGITGIELPENLTYIGDLAFSNCTQLLSIEIPDRVTEIAYQAFIFTSLEKIIVRGQDMPALGEQVFVGLDFTVYCYEFTAADFWAQDNGYPVVYLDGLGENAPASITLPADCDLWTGTSMTIEAELFPAVDASCLTWTSSDETVLTVSGGVVTIVGPGTATVTASCGDVKDEMVITVRTAAASFALNCTELHLVAKESFQLEVCDLTPADADVSFTYTSSNTTSVQVSGTGLMTTRMPGSAVITVTSTNGLTAECAVTVYYPVTAVEFAQGGQETAVIGGEMQLMANVTARDAEVVNKLVTFTTSDETIATVDENGLVTFVGAGEVEITAAAASGVSATITITVECPGHVEEIVPGKEATCTAPGLTDGKQCAVCGEVLVEQEIIFASGHDYAEEITLAPTCTDEGVKTFTCTVCGDAYTEAIAALGHTEEILPAVEATWTEEGLTEGTHCASCGTVFQAQERIPAIGPNVKPNHANCGNTCGTELRFANGCGYTWTENGKEYVCDGACYNHYTNYGYTEHCAMISHASSAYWAERGYTKDQVVEMWQDCTGPNVVPPTCTENGYSTGDCIYCRASISESIKYHIVPALGHTEAPDKVTFLPTCTEAGSVTTFCLTCGEAIAQEEIPAPGHIPAEGAETFAPTCTAEGKTVYTCTACGNTYEEIIPAAGHTEVIDEAVAPTCTETGLTDGKHCSVCGEVLVAQEEVSALGHDYNEVITSKPTCTEEGVKTFTCTVCGDAYTEAIRAKGHSGSSGETTFGATCSKPGYRVTYCGVCGEEASRVEIPMKPHTEAIDEAVDPTCTETGLTEGSHCSVCDKVLTAQQIVPALGHVEDIIEDHDVSCTRSGLEGGLYCLRCGAILKEPMVIPALGHDHSQITVTVEATCTAEGEAIHACIRCEDYYVEVIPATGHDETIDAPVDPTCTSSGLTEGSHCAVCSEVLVAQEEIPALGHVEELIPAVPRGDLTPGYTEGRKCSACGEILAQPELIPPIFEVVNGELVRYNGTATEVVIPANGGITRIGEQLFEYNTSITSVVIPEGVTHIGYAAFSGTYAMGKVVLPSTLRHIEDRAFWYFGYECDQKPTVNLPDGLVFIGSNAFGTHRQMTYTLPITVTSMGENPFGDFADVICDLRTQGELLTVVAKYYYNLFDHSATDYQVSMDLSKTPIELRINGYEGDDNKVALPETIAGYPVTALQLGWPWWEEVLVPDCVTEIEVDQYADFSGLTIVSSWDAYARTWANEKGIAWRHDVHTEEVLSAVAPTCSSTGLTEGKRCSVCGEVLTAQEIIPALPHTEEIIPAVAPSCTSTGLTEGVRCSVCGEVLIGQEIVPALGHVEDMIEDHYVTCTQSGLEGGLYCLRCYEILKEPVVIPALGHDHVSTVTIEPTCTAEGEMLYACTRCEDSYTEVIPALGHVEEIISAVPRGDLTPGYTEGVKCAVCGEILVAPQYIPPIFEVEDGVLVRYNGDAKAVVIPEYAGITKIGDGLFRSNAVITSVTIPMGVREIGEYAFFDCINLNEVILPTGLQVIGEYAFSHCKMLEELELPKGLTTICSHALEWNGVSPVNIPASVTNIGSDFVEAGRTVTLNLATQGELAADAAGVEIIPNEAPEFQIQLVRVTADEKPYVQINRYLGADNTIVVPDEICGYEVKYISGLGRTDSSKIIVCSPDSAAAAFAQQYGVAWRCIKHTETIVPGYESTYEASGLTEGVYCTACQSWVKPQETIPAKKHNIVIQAAVEPTCAADGLTEGIYCATCGLVFSEQERIPATGEHMWNRGEVLREATCSVPGLKVYTCYSCGGTEEETLEAGHVWIDATLTVMPTKTVPGEMTYTCRLCGLVKTAPILYGLPGDSNDDGIVDMLDVIDALEWFCGGSVELNLANTDVNGDGVSDMLDVITILAWYCGDESIILVGPAEAGGAQ